MPTGRSPRRQISPGGMMPCRHCLADIATGEPYLILALRPFPEARPYAGPGPDLPARRAWPAPSRRPASCPAMLLEHPGYLVAATVADDQAFVSTAPAGSWRPRR